MPSEPILITAIEEMLRRLLAIRSDSLGRFHLVPVIVEKGTIPPEDPYDVPAYYISDGDAEHEPTAGKDHKMEESVDVWYYVRAEGKETLADMRIKARNDIVRAIHQDPDTGNLSRDLGLPRVRDCIFRRSSPDRGIRGNASWGWVEFVVKYRAEGSVL